MNVGQLIEYLGKFDPEIRVMIATDAEGNGFWTAEFIDWGFVHPEDARGFWAEEIIEPDDAEDAESLVEGGYEPRIVIWP